MASGPFDLIGPRATTRTVIGDIGFTGTLPGAGYAKGMTAFLSARQIRIFDYP